jgi:hypothetical protein
MDGELNTRAGEKKPSSKKKNTNPQGSLFDF